MLCALPSTFAKVNRNEGLGFDEFIRLMRKIREDEEIILKAVFSPIYITSIYDL